MEQSTQRIIMSWAIVAGIFVVVALIGWGVVSTIKNLPAPESRRNQELIQGIVLQNPSLATPDNKPIFSIAKQSKIAPGWYVVAIKRNDLTSNILLRDNYRDIARMQIVAGPSTRFSNGELQTKGLSADLIEGILKS